MTNPVGAFLPAPQEGLQADWERELSTRYGIVFDELYTITNMPISRFLEWLEDSGNLQGYMDRLRDAFNSLAADGVMCRDLVSVSYDGDLYDCDFNQMLQMPISTDEPTKPQTGDLTMPQTDERGQRPSVLTDEPRALLDALAKRTIRTGPHCFGCTAGCGSSCGGATV